MPLLRLLHVAVTRRIRHLSDLFLGERRARPRSNRHALRPQPHEPPDGTRQLPAAWGMQPKACPSRTVRREAPPVSSNAAMIPVVKEKYLSTITLDDPRLVLREGSDRIGIDVRVRTKVPLLAEYTGRVAAAGKLAYRVEEKAFYLEDPTIEKIEIADLKAEHVEKVRAPIEAVAAIGPRTVSGVRVQGSQLERAHGRARAAERDRAGRSTARGPRPTVLARGYDVVFANYRQVERHSGMSRAHWGVPFDCDEQGSGGARSSRSGRERAHAAHVRLGEGTGAKKPNRFRWASKAPCWPISRRFW